MVKTAWVYPLSGRWFHRFGQCVAFSLFMLQKWRWRFLNSLLDLFDLWRYSDFPARNWHGSIHGAGWNRSVGIGPLFQGYWLGITCHCILAQRLLHCHSSMESVLSISGTGKLFFFKFFLQVSTRISVRNPSKVLQRCFTLVSLW